MALHSFCRALFVHLAVLWIASGGSGVARAQAPSDAPDLSDETAQVDDLADTERLTVPHDEGPASMPARDAPHHGGPSVDEALATASFHRELRTVEEDVSSLKERVFRSKATLELLKELVIDAAASGSRVVLWHINELGGGYSMESVQYFLDGKNVYSKIDPEGSLDEERELKVHEQTLPPGSHELQVNMTLRGRGYGLFSYLRAYQFKLQSSYTFNVQEGMVSMIRAVADSRGGLKSFVERPRIQYEDRQETFREE